jgi:hypothetical protein
MDEDAFTWRIEFYFSSQTFDLWVIDFWTLGNVALTFGFFCMQRTKGKRMDLRLPLPWNNKKIEEKKYITQWGLKHGGFRTTIGRPLIIERHIYKLYGAKIWSNMHGNVVGSFFLPAPPPRVHLVSPRVSVACLSIPSHVRPNLAFMLSIICATDRPQFTLLVELVSLAGCVKFCIP